MKVIVDRSKWDRAGEDPSAEESHKIMTEDGRCCILGFIGKSYGLPDHDLMDSFIPYGFKWPSWLFVRARNPTYPITGMSSTAIKCVEVNDKGGSYKKREAKLKTLLSKVGVELEFIN